MTDHRPLVSIFSNTQARPSPRIERWCLRLQQYNFVTEYRPGANNPADFMSRSPQKSSPGEGRKVTENYVRYVCESSSPKAISKQVLEEATREDHTLQQVITSITTGEWYKYNDKEMSLYERIQDQLSVTSDGIVMRNHRIVIPSSLRCKVVEIAHEGHQGIVRTKSLLRSKVWFPHIDDMVENIVKNCPACATVVPEHKIQPMKMSELPKGPWQQLSADFCGPYPSGHYCLVVIDEYTRFPAVEIITSTSANTVIPIMDKIFASHGIPLTLKTDNGPPFQSAEFKKFMEYCQIKHRRITPLWPRANAQAEGFMKPLNKAIKAAQVEGKSWRKNLYRFLRNYRATPHPTTGRPPAELLYGRNIRILLPEVAQPVADKDIRKRDQERKARAKENADKRISSKEEDSIHPGDDVLMKQQQKNKLTPPYNPRPMRVVKVKGTMVTAENEEAGQKTRNISFFKKLHQVPRERRIPEDPDIDILDAEEELAAQPGEYAVNNPVIVNRPNRPQREKRAPNHYKDYVT